MSLTETMRKRNLFNNNNSCWCHRNEIYGFPRSKSNSFRSLAYSWKCRRCWCRWNVIDTQQTVVKEQAEGSQSIKGPSPINLYSIRGRKRVAGVQTLGRTSNWFFKGSMKWKAEGINRNRNAVETCLSLRQSNKCLSLDFQWNRSVVSGTLPLLLSAKTADFLLRKLTESEKTCSRRTTRVIATDVNEWVKKKF